MKLWIQTALNYSREGKIDAALDLVYDNIIDTCNAGEYAMVDAALLDFIEVNDIDLQLGALTSSRSYRGHLPNRAILREHFAQQWKDHADVGTLLRFL